MSISRPVLQNREGAVLIFVGVAMVALLGFVALSVDIGRLYAAKLEVRRAADAATLAAITAYGDIADTASARAEATTRAALYLARNPVQNRSLPSDDVTVVANGATRTVQITITATIKTAFARVLGVNSVLTRSSATAGFGTSNSVRCLRPVLMPDYWDDRNNNGIYDTGDYYQTDSTGLGSRFRNSSSSYTRDFGRPETIEEFSGTQVRFGSFLLTQTGNAQTMISDTTCANNNYTIGQSIGAVSGHAIGQVVHGFQDLWDMDTGMSFNTTSQTFTGTAWPDWRDSPRSVTVALYNPTTAPTSSTVNIVGFATAVLVARPANSDHVFSIRYANVRGVSSVACTTSCSQMTSFVRLTN